MKSLPAKPSFEQLGASVFQGSASCVSVQLKVSFGILGSCCSILVLGYSHLFETLLGQNGLTML